VLLSIWLAVMLGVHTLVMTYWQSLFASIDDEVNWNGYVYAVSYVLAAMATLLPAKIEHLIVTILLSFCQYCADLMGSFVCIRHQVGKGGFCQLFLYLEEDFCSFWASLSQSINHILYLCSTIVYLNLLFQLCAPG